MNKKDNLFEEDVNDIIQSIYRIDKLEDVKKYLCKRLEYIIDEKN